MAWKVKRLGEIIAENPKSKTQVKESLDKGKYIFFTSGEKTRFSNSYICDGENVFLATGGKAVVTFYKGNADYSTDTYSIKGKGSVVLTKFLFYYILFNLKKIEEKMFLGATIKHLQKKDFKNLIINLPPISEQKHIVDILDKSFEKLSKAKENVEKNLLRVKELFESYLQNIFENPEGEWAEKKLGEVCALFQGLAINSKTSHLLVEKSDYPLLRIKDLRNNSEEQYVKFEGIPKNAFVNENEIIYTRTGNSLGLVFRGRKGVLHNNSFKIIPDEKILLNDYIFLWLQEPVFKNKIFNLASKAAQPDITHKLFKAQLIKIPKSLSEQKSVVKKIDKLSVEIKKLETLYEKKLADLEELKKSIIQKVFSGELTEVSS
jgi:type I restriction enzyme, S subunit